MLSCFYSFCSRHLFNSPRWTVSDAYRQAGFKVTLALKAVHSKE